MPHYTAKGVNLISTNFRLTYRQLSVCTVYILRVCSFIAYAWAPEHWYAIAYKINDLLININKLITIDFYQFNKINEPHRGQFLHVSFLILFYSVSVNRLYYHRVRNLLILNLRSLFCIRVLIWIHITQSQLQLQSKNSNNITNRMLSLVKSEEMKERRILRKKNTCIQWYTRRHKNERIAQKEVPRTWLFFFLLSSWSCLNKRYMKT